MQGFVSPGYRAVCLLAIGISVGLLVNSSAAVFAHEPVNSVNYNSIIKSGTYENTVGGKTVFYNPHGLWLQKGSTLKSVEINSAGQQDGNGGTVLLEAPKSVVRLDGNINADGNTAIGQIGKGGNVTIDAAYLYQSGNIFARGSSNGGIVNINVNSATFTPTAGIDTTSAITGLGGVINVKSTGVVDLQKNNVREAIMTTNGGTTANANVIDIHSGLVNNVGILRADGVAGFNGNPGSTGGTIRLTASGCINLQPVADALNNTKVFTPCETPAILSHLKQIATIIPAERNQIINRGNITADGGSNADGAGSKGGNITLNATVFVGGETSADVGSSLTANGGFGTNHGGDGGTITANMGLTFANIINRIFANGGNGFSRPGAIGGNGGIIRVNTHLFNNRTDAFITANGGNGTADQSSGGNGGLVSLHADEKYSPININIGFLQAVGGNGSGDSLSKGGAGGRIEEVNIFNGPGGLAETDPGRP